MSVTVPRESGFTPRRENIPAATKAAMIGLTTPHAEARYEFRWHDGGPFVVDDGTDPYSESAVKRNEVARARERDRDSHSAPFVVLWKYISGFDMDHFERVGRRFARQTAVDGLARLIGVERGSALRIRPDEELRRKIRLFKDIQAAREAAFELTGKGPYGGKDVPLRLGLGGLQDFTPGPGVKTPTSVPRATLRGGHTRKPPDSCSRSSRYFGSTVSTYR